VMSKLEPNARWDGLVDGSTDDLDTDLHAVLGTMRASGLTRVYRTDMSVPELPFAVVKVWAPETRDIT